MSRIYPSLIASDLLNMQTTINQLDPYVAGYHIDVMDFHFVPNLTLGPDFINAIRLATKKPLLVHLMVDYPERYFERIKLNKGDIVSIHPESPSEKSPTELLQEIKNHGWRPSLAINPETEVAVIATVKAPLDHILLMSVNPGFSGQKFMPIVYEKINQIKDIEKKTNQSYTIAIDGGINKGNAQKLITSGAHQLVMGSALFDTVNPAEQIKAMNKLLS